MEIRFTIIIHGPPSVDSEWKHIGSYSLEVKAIAIDVPLLGKKVNYPIGYETINVYLLSTPSMTTFVYSDVLLSMRGKFPSAVISVPESSQPHTTPTGAADQ